MTLQLFTGKPPFHRLSNEAQVVLALHKQQRPAKPSFETADEAAALGFSDAVWEVMQRCWVCEPDARPSASELMPILTPHPEVTEDELMSSGVATSRRGGQPVEREREWIGTRGARAFTVTGGGHKLI